MRRKSLAVRRTLLASAAFALLSGGASAAPINVVAYGSLTGTGLEDFEGIAAGSLPGTNYDAILDLDGASYAERFSGQTLGAAGNFDTLTGVPTGPLSLVAGAANENLVAADLGGVGITGLGPLGYPIDDANGEGALSILLDVDSAEFGIEIRGTNAGTARFEFFRRDGSLIDVVALTGLTDGFYGFSRDGGTVDIAGISITNDDASGIGYDNVLFQELPEPAAGLLLAFAVVALARVAPGVRSSHEAP